MCISDTSVPSDEKKKVFQVCISCGKNVVFQMCISGGTISCFKYAVVRLILCFKRAVQ